MTTGAVDKALRVSVSASNSRLTQLIKRHIELYPDCVYILSVDKSTESLSSSVDATDAVDKTGPPAASEL